MIPKVKYITDQSGQKTAVIINIEEWNALQKELETFRQQKLIKESIETGFGEVRQWKKGDKKLMSLKDFLENEC